MEDLDIIAIGELLIDFTPEGEGSDGFPVIAAHPGGSVANYLAAAAARGAKTALCAKVGDDAFGKLLVNAVKECGVDTSHIVLTDEAFTTLAFVTLDANGERDFSFSRKPGADTLLQKEDLDADLLEHTKVLHFSTVGMTDEPSRSAHKYFIEEAREKGVILSFDPNLREPLWRDLEDAKEQMFWGLERADVVKISDNEVEFLTGETAEAGGRILFDKYRPQIMFVTCGASGCRYYFAGGDYFIAAPAGVHPVDTTGAGDIFGGTAMAAVVSSGKAPGELGREELDEITALACTAASLSTERPGGISSIIRR